MFEFRVSRGNLTKFLLSFPEIPETQTSRAISTNTWHFHTPFLFISNHHHLPVTCITRYRLKSLRLYEYLVSIDNKIIKYIVVSAMNISYMSKTWMVCDVYRICACIH